MTDPSSSPARHRRAIVGGRGRLADLVADASPSDTCIYAPEGVGFGTDGRSARSFRVERLGGLIADMRSRDVGELVLAGAMRRPRLELEQMDRFTRTAMTRLAPAMRAGDDTLLRTVISIFEEEGFRVLPAQEAAPALLPETGLLSRARPSPQDEEDATRGFEVLRLIGAADIGQSLAVAQGQVLAVEAGPGTDWMLDTLSGDVPGRPEPHDGRGVLCKAPKPGQDRRVDLPVIGPKTVRAAARAGLAGLAVEAGGVMVLDRSEVTEAADEVGLFVWVRAS
ncbi:LpxI family protein [Roseitranquillus sediminis]|uniref:LpxI family protein n=1 Tax=Roseitranquillus sediminis TaxID=2809051 RepID=UPI001D0C8BD9|nr:UDP-2,3-diacylglucosamine diphosphatase LpxI [Roseitranquillus sediminis]MBM9595633.1 UDP-2,3-diacylglucosamine diphosphatase LpxI [Roseitranquillus sediminis]